MFDEYQALAQVMLGLDPAEDPPDHDAFLLQFEERFGCSIESLEKVADALLPLTVPQPTPLGGSLQQFFGIEAPTGVWHAILRRPYRPRDLEVT